MKGSAYVCLPSGLAEWDVACSAGLLFERRFPLKPPSAQQPMAIGHGRSV